MKLNQAPEWRWQRARDLIEHGKAPTRTRDDRNIIRAHKYLRMWDIGDHSSVSRVRFQYPLIHCAHMLYQDSESGCRWILEAGLMADRPADELAEYLNTETEVIQVYEDLFFDVRNALKHRGCILGSVLMPAISHGIIPHDPDFFWKLLAYHGNWDTVKAMWETDAMTPAAHDFYTRTFNEAVLKKGWMAAQTVNANQFNAVELIQTAMQLLRDEHAAGADQARDTTQASLKSLLNSITISVHRTGDDLGSAEDRLQPQVKTIESQAEELSDVSSAPTLPSAQAAFDKVNSDHE
jgi:hypothetical protein